MLMQIITRTPPWVFVLFIVLLALGVSQIRARTASLTRVTVLPVAMLALAISGVVSAFGSGSLGLLALVVWAKGAIASGLWVATRKNDDGARYNPTLKQFTLPGSTVPLAIIMGIFCTKYAVGVSLGMQPELAQNTWFALSVSALYGVFSGIFAARAVRLWRLARRRSALPVIA